MSSVPVSSSLVLLFLLSSTLTEACPDGWVRTNGRCYKVTEDSMNWAAARQVRANQVGRYFMLVFFTWHHHTHPVNIDLFLLQYCGSAGGYLVEVNDEDEQVREGCSFCVI